MACILVSDVVCPITNNCMQCLGAPKNSCIMAWLANNTVTCIPRINATDGCVSLVTNVTQCSIMEECQKRPTCGTCVPVDNKIGCIWCSALNRCASNFTHVADIHELITDNEHCKFLFSPCNITRSKTLVMQTIS